ncbi:MAG: phosphomethylpyrimidine kinase [Methanoregula sp.]|nr:phosphomethylpyrimidine kinase [Methanoregula sp.]
MMDPVQERSEVLGELEKAVVPLVSSMNLQFIPEKGAQIGYAIRGARDKNSVAAIDGRLTGKNGAVQTGGPCSFGSDDEVARVILTIMKFDPRRRSAALLKFSSRALQVLDEDLFLECVKYDAAKAPQGITTMDWGIASCCNDGVPDVIYSPGTRGANAVLILLGEEPVDVANNIIICSNRI